MKKAMLLLAACAMSVSTVVGAHAADQKNSTKPVNKWACKDFLMLDSSYRPTAVAFAEGITKKDKVVDPMLDVQGIERVVPIIVQECTDNKNDNFVAKVKAHTEKSTSMTH
ncbi:acid-activated periplasmic chaperone HdeA [Commensalibacter oyaizuii]|uniref:Acid-activated periplasmic chaperone HdeA n=1 Tax=Commensalibacter oyaizuii TaxID=3043873 RepID=A0ABT6Q292_9PROT|nr:acid-activated periplasmic chaperone HdeA [Commensalibacter sp. TBRC 16381]MDI2091209.1 acid-activated periplasmic chaperone HdeA [Commensalibacter sp. TBRC 16381]